MSRLRGSNPTSTLKPDLGNANVGRSERSVYQRSIPIGVCSVFLDFPLDADIPSESGPPEQERGKQDGLCYTDGGGT